MNKCFFLEPVEINISDARRFGKIVYLFPGESYRPGIFNDDFGDAVLDKLEEHGYDVDNDYFCVTGAFAPVALAIAHLTSLYVSCKLLIYNLVTHEYEVVAINTSQENHHATENRHIG